MGSLEQRRLLLEELDVIEMEISRRFKRNALLWDSPESRNILGGKKRPLKETLLQQHEILMFVDQYKKQYEVLSETLQPVDVENDPKLDKFDQLYLDIEAFHAKYPDRPIDNLSRVYLMYSSAPDQVPEELEDSRGKRRKLRTPILSSFAAALNIDSIFTEEEQLGNYLDLIQFHQDWLNIPGNDLTLSYSEYLDIFNKMPYPNTINLKYDKGSSQYLKYIDALANYLKQFYIKIQPLQKPKISIQKIESDFTGLDKDHEFKNNEQENQYQLNKDGTVKCLVCDKNFAKFTVYKGHLNSKKHLKNIPATATKPRISPVSKEDVSTILKAEHMVKEVTALLSKQISSTRTNVERKKMLTDRERTLEIESLRKLAEDELFETDEEDRSDADDEGSDSERNTVDNPLKLPLGPDGRPIPYWLFKLSGLRMEFSCEVCGNIVYQGRKNYIAHFGEAKHLNGLKLLGVDTSLVGAFKGISKIKDVTDLKEKLSLQSKRELNLLENVEEVEDEEGNVMSRRDYEDLKKQGLI